MIVYLYILLTLGLLIAAVVRPYATVWFNVGPWECLYSY